MLMEGRPGVRQTGLSRYETRLAEALARIGEDELVLYAQPEARELGIATDATWRTPPRSVANPALRIAWELTGMAVQARRDRLDLLHGMAFVVPPLCFEGMTRPGRSAAPGCGFRTRDEVSV